MIHTDPKQSDIANIERSVDGDALGLIRNEPHTMWILIHYINQIGDNFVIPIASRTNLKV